MLSMDMSVEEIRSHKLAMFEASCGASAQAAWVELKRPLTAFGVNKQMSEQLTHPTLAGHTLVTPAVHLPIGMEVMSITCTAEDADRGWLLVNLALGTLQLVNPQGGPVNLSAFDPRMPHVDKIAPWILSKTKVDVQVVVGVQNGAYGYGLPRTLVEIMHANGVELAELLGVTEGIEQLRTKIFKRERSTKVRPRPRAGRHLEAVFHGLSINAFQEEQVCAIQTRIEPTDRQVGCAELIMDMRRTVSAVVFAGTPRSVSPSPAVPLDMLSGMLFSGSYGGPFGPAMPNPTPTPFGGPHRAPVGFGAPPAAPTSGLASPEDKLVRAARVVSAFGKSLAGIIAS